MIPHAVPDKIHAAQDVQQASRKFASGCFLTAVALCAYLQPLTRDVMERVAFSVLWSPYGPAVGIRGPQVPYYA